MENSINTKQIYWYEIGMRIIFPIYIKLDISAVGT